MHTTKITTSFLVTVCVAAILLTAQGVLPAAAQPTVVSTDKITEILNIFKFVHTPANVVQLQVASDKTLYAWQNLSAFHFKAWRYA